MSKKVTPTREAVLSTLWTLDFGKTGVSVTAEDVAKTLGVEVEAIAPFLKELRRKRVIRKALVAGKVIWIPHRGQRAESTRKVGGVEK